MVCSLYSTTIMNNEDRRDAEDYRSMLKWRKQQELIKEQKKHDDALKFGSETIYPSLSKVVVKDVKPLSPSLQFKSALIKKPNSSIKQVAQSQIYTNTIKSQTHTNGDNPLKWKNWFFSYCYCYWIRIKCFLTSSSMTFLLIQC